jgi:hypothetical protein
MKTHDEEGRLYVCGAPLFAYTSVRREAAARYIQRKAMYTDNKVVDPDPPKRHIFGAFPSIKIHTMLLLLLLSLVASIQ